MNNRGFRGGRMDTNEGTPTMDQIDDGRPLLWASVGPLQRAIMSCLDDQHAWTREELADEVGRPARQVEAALAGLLSRGWVGRATGWYMTPAGRQAR
jgi:hypothetical protein